MKTAPTRRVFLLLSLALLVPSQAKADPPACETLSAWSEPENLGPPVNTEFAEAAATLSRNGLSLYFTSNRPGGLGANDIWVSQRACADCPWEDPVNLTILNSEAADAGPSLSTDGHLLFFHSGRPGGQGGLDIWMSRRADPNNDFGWEAPGNLGPDVNTADGELMPEYVHQADFYLERGGVPANTAALYFGRGTGPNPGNNQDIYTAPLTRDSQTLGPAVLVDVLRSDANDAAPSVSTNQKEIYFGSGRPGGPGGGDIYVATRQNAREPWSEPENLGPPVNTPFLDQ